MDISAHTTRVIVYSVVGLLAVIIVRWGLGVVIGHYERRLDRTDPAHSARRRTTLRFLQQVIVALVAGIAIWNVLSLYDATASIGKALFASSAVLALFVGLAFSTPLSNLGSGLLVAFSQPVRLGDRVTIADQTGFVEKIELIYTTLVTDDSRRVYIPNSQLTTSTIINRTIRDPRRSVNAEFPVALATPVAAARAALRQAISELPGTNGDEARVLVGQITEHSVWLEAVAYAPLEADVGALASDLRERGLSVLREKGFLPV